MDNKKSKVMCIILLNMLDAELSKLIDSELDESNNTSNPELVERLINVLDDIDDAIEVLKILSHKYDIPIVAMSSLNRMSYSDPDLASMKGSGEIEYTASTVFLLSDVDAEKKKPPQDLNARTSNRSCRDMSRTRMLRITAAKNRMGARNVSTVLRFNEEYNYFQEVL